MPTIRIDDEVWEYLKGKAVPFEDSPNDVLRRLFGLNSRGHAQREDSFSRGRRRKMGGLRYDGMPETEFEVPILEALDQLSERGRSEQVLERVYNLVKDKLHPVDLEDLPSGGPRWEKKAAWAKYFMAKKRPPWVVSLHKGEWAITEEGKRILQNARSISRRGAYR